MIWPEHQKRIASDEIETVGRIAATGAEGRGVADEAAMGPAAEGVGAAIVPAGAGIRVMRPSAPRTNVNPLASALDFFARRFLRGVDVAEVGEAAGLGEDGAVWKNAVDLSGTAGERFGEEGFRGFGLLGGFEVRT